MKLLDNIKEHLLSLSRTEKKTLLVVFDALAISFALWSSLVIRTGNIQPYMGYLLEILPVLIVTTILLFIRLGLYRAVLRFLGNEVVWAIIKGVTLSSLILAAIVSVYRLEAFPRSVLFIYWMLAILYVGGSRYLMRNFLAGRDRKYGAKKTVIYGAGSAGHQLSLMLRHNQDIKPVYFIDDKRSLWGTKINGIPVHPVSELGNLINDKGVDQILLAMPAITRSRRKQIVDNLEEYPIHVYTIPAVSDIVAGKASVDDIREVDVEDLLGRDPVKPDPELFHACVKDKVVMVTGAGGSIGSELSRQIINLQPKLLILFESSEYALYKIEQELIGLRKSSNFDEFPIIAILGNVQDYERVEHVINSYNVQTIYHAAAYKHVPIVENNIIEGVRNNIFGTLATAKAALNNNVEVFVLISTDKAVRPTSVMGATKRFAELALQAMAETEADTRISMVRFGNVLDSSGSVVPLFREQIRKGGPVTVTHTDIIRYFMTIPEAAQLVIQAGSMGERGEVFVLDMGEPVKIYDLAKRLIHLSGLTVKDDNNQDGDIEIKVTGLRPGEKLYEELLVGDNVTGTKHPRIMQEDESYISIGEFESTIHELSEYINDNDMEGILKVLKHNVSGYVPEKEIKDKLWKQKQSITLKTDGISKDYNVVNISNVQDDKE